MTTSSPSTAPAAPASPGEAPFLGLKGDDGADGGEKDEAKAALEKQLQEAKDAHREERFVWIVVTVILIDVLWFRNAPNAVVPVIVLLLAAVILFILANRLGVDEAKGLFERLIHGITRSTGDH